MTAQLQQQQQQMHSRDHESRLGILENAVSGIGSRLDAIANKLDEKGKVPLLAIIGSVFGAITLTVTLVSAIGALAFSPLSSGMMDLKAALVKIESKSDRYVPREDLDTRFNVVTQRRDDLQRLTDNRIERVERDVDAIAKQVVPRGEHEQMWAAQRARDADLQRQADQNRQGLYDLNTPRDTIQGMQRRIDELERDARAPARR